MENAILFGNGLNLLNNGISWDDLLKKISDREHLIGGIPNTMQYETIILASDYFLYEPFILADGKQFITADGNKFMVKDKPAEEALKNKIKFELENFTSNFAYERLSRLNVEHFITTNYDNTLYNLFCSKGYIKGISNNTESLYSIRRRFGLQCDNITHKYIWPIHGTIHYPKSMMLGLDHYCGSIAKINAYIKGEYNYTKEGKPFILKDIISRLRNKECEMPLSWIDLFFTHNIHIIGFGLQYDEIDLWWILNRRQRYIRQYGEMLISNKIYFYGNIEDNKKALLMRLGVEVVSFEHEGLNTADPLYYNKQYDYYLNMIEKHGK